MDSLPRRFLTPLKILAAQALALGCLWAARDALPLGTTVLLFLTLQGAIAAAIGLAFGLGRSWLPVQLLLPIAFVYGAALPGWIYLAGFVLIVLVFWNSPTERVPLYLTNRDTIAEIAKLASDTGAARFADLGSGTGTVTMRLARMLPELSADGYENAPLPFAMAWMRRLFAGPANASFTYGSLWRADLSPYDIVYCFLSPAPMARLFEKAEAEMRPGALFISNSFAVPDIAAEREITLDDARGTQLYIYRIAAA